MARIARVGRPKKQELLASARLPDEPQTPLYGQLKAHLEHLEIRAYSPRTVESRARDVKLFIVWCKERGIVSAAEIRKPIVVQFQRWLFHFRKKNDAPLSATTQHRRLSAIKQFFSWLTKENWLDANPAADVELPKVQQALPKDILTAAEVERVMVKPDITDPLGIRDRAILEVLYSTGIRRMELIGLGLYDVDEARGCLHVRHGKGGRSRVIPIGDRALAWARKYLEEVRPRLDFDPEEQALFLSASGFPLSRHWLGHVVRRYLDGADIKKPGSCHLFRHTMATLMLENGADIRFIQAMLGHAKIDTTQIYTHVSVAKLREVHAATHPARFPATREREEPLP